MIGRCRGLIVRKLIIREHARTDKTQNGDVVPAPSSLHFVRVRNKKFGYHPGTTSLSAIASVLLSPFEADFNCVKQHDFLSGNIFCTFRTNG